jgi:hypothetical protein
MILDAEQLLHDLWDDLYEHLSDHQCGQFDYERGYRGFPRPGFCRAWLQQNGCTPLELDLWMAWFEKHGGSCDCEVWMNVLTEPDGVTERLARTG